MYLCYKTSMLQYLNWDSKNVLNEILDFSKSRYFFSRIRIVNFLCAFLQILLIKIRKLVFLFFCCFFLGGGAGHKTLKLKFSKTNVFFEISTFKTGYWQNIFWPKEPKFGCFGSKYLKTNVTFEISTFVIRVQAKFH